MNSAEFRLRYHLLGQTHREVRPLSEKECVHTHNIPTKAPAHLNSCSAIETGANSLAEGFLFSVATALILAEA
jgi:hypothetical protein